MSMRTLVFPLMTVSSPPGVDLFNVINVRDYGAVGNGSTDDAYAIQTAFNAAFGPPENPHGNENKWQNQPVYFPAGNYAISTPLYLINVHGAWIFGEAENSVTISYIGALSGNTVIANGVTPCIMTNGVQYTRIENLSFVANSTDNTTGIYLYQDIGFITTSDTFINCSFEGFTTGVLGGYQSPSGNCDNMQFFNCWFTDCSLAGIRTMTGNVLNYSVYGGGGTGCAFDSGGPAANGGALYSCVSGGFSPFIGVTCRNNKYDIIHITGNGVTVIGGDSNSQESLVLMGGPSDVRGFYHHPVNSSGSKFVNCASSGMATISSCIFNPENENGAGRIVETLGSGRAVLDGVVSLAGGSTSVIYGSSPAKLYTRGCVFSNPNTLSGFTGTHIDE